jgi:hypothetical protein
VDRIDRRIIGLDMGDRTMNITGEDGARMTKRKPRSRPDQTWTPAQASQMITCWTITACKLNINLLPCHRDWTAACLEVDCGLEKLPKLLIHGHYRAQVFFANQCFPNTPDRSIWHGRVRKKSLPSLSMPRKMFRLSVSASDRTSVLSQSVTESSVSPGLTKNKVESEKPTISIFIL